eukprot:TRINITY_DN416_c0_g1_i2.p2 TRINITY_DN416_c0_g1~~TRINITY_DN416_c0_g1_i2.p2  ORF type:complete len:182 (+),score=74.12 TRINITY_DN416_c0_g1_i2:826-1371(+)
MIDIRKEGNVDIGKSYRGTSGGIRSLASHPTEDVFAAAGLDRFLHVYRYNQRQPIKKIYIKQRVNRIIFSAEGFVNKKKDEEEEEEKEDTKELANEEEVGDEEEDELWDSIPNVEEDEKLRKKRQLKTKKVVGKKRKATEKEDKEDDDDDDEEGKFNEKNVKIAYGQSKKKEKTLKIESWF